MIMRSIAGPPGVPKSKQARPLPLLGRAPRRPVPRLRRARCPWPARRRLPHLLLRHLCPWNRQSLRRERFRQERRQVLPKIPGRHVPGVIHLQGGRAPTARSERVQAGEALFPWGQALRVRRALTWEGKGQRDGHPPVWVRRAARVAPRTTPPAYRRREGAADRTCGPRARPFRHGLAQHRPFLPPRLPGRPGRRPRRKFRQAPGTAAVARSRPTRARTTA